MRKTKQLALVLASLLCLLAGAAVAEAPWDTAVALYQAGEIETTDAEREAGNPIFVITMENGDTMRGELYPDIAPHAVGNFIALANSGYYDGRIFHRVIPGFMIQGGSPTGNGIGNAGWSIPGEFAANGVENNLAHTYGVLSMGRTMASYDSAGTQFFIMTTQAYPSLDGQYAAFGLVTEGMDVAMGIVNTPTDTGDKPLAEQKMQSVRVETFGKDYPFDKLQ